MQNFGHECFITNTAMIACDDSVDKFVIGARKKGKKIIVNL